MEAKRSNLWKWLIKLVLSAVAIGWIARKMDFGQALDIAKHTAPVSLVGAFILYNLSQLVGAARLQTFLNDSKLKLPWLYVAALYYRGMFYNLFLPGGIGGDGFKVFVLHRRYGASVKTLIKAHLFDRLSGLTALAVLFLASMLLIVFEQQSERTVFIVFISLLMVYPVYLLGIFFVSPVFVRSVVKTSCFSLILQGLQLLSAYLLLSGMGVEQQFVEYGAVFLLSSVATVIPITLGGLGARELTFVLLAPYTSINPSVAVAFSLLFFVISTASSLPGIFIGKFDVTPAENLRTAN